MHFGDPESVKTVTAFAQRLTALTVQTSPFQPAHQCIQTLHPVWQAPQTFHWEVNQDDTFATGRFYRRSVFKRFGYANWRIFRRLTLTIQRSGLY